MKNVLKIILFTMLVTAFYGYVGQMVPQKEVHPPKDLVVGAEMTTEELVQAGKQIAEGKGTCMGCHTIGSHAKGRFPDLGGVGARAATRRPGVSAVDYLAEALYEPNAYIVEGYSPGMPPIGKPPISLSDAEMLAVIAYLQSLGGEPTVTGTTRLKYASSGPAPSGQPAAKPADQAAVMPGPGAANSGVAVATAPAASAATGAEGAAAAGAAETPSDLLARHGCFQCHGREPGVKTLGPSFHGIGKRLDAASIYESILDPDAVTAKGYPPGVMAATLKATGFYGKVTAQEIKSMVAFLSESKGSAKGGSKGGGSKGGPQARTAAAAKGGGKK